MKDYDSLHGVYVDDKCFLINLTECYYPPSGRSLDMKGILLWSMCSYMCGHISSHTEGASRSMCLHWILSVHTLFDAL